jgi:transcriptional regulator
MYLPNQFNDQQYILDVMRDHPFASLISNDQEGFPFVTHLPLHVDKRGESLFILGHCAKANPHWTYLELRPEALVTFTGPQAYMSPRVYPDLVRVPTWNYIAIHLRVRAKIVAEENTKDLLLKQLIADHEQAYAAQWRGLPDKYTTQMLGAIVGFELEVLDIQSKFKLNQHRPEAHSTMYQNYLKGNEQEQALAAWMRKLNMKID